MITTENLHIWNPMNPWHKQTLLVSMPDHELKQFEDKDQAINYLYLNGYKISARELRAVKDSKL